MCISSRSCLNYDYDYDDCYYYYYLSRYHYYHLYLSILARFLTIATIITIYNDYNVKPAVNPNSLLALFQILSPATFTWRRTLLSVS